MKPSKLQELHSSEFGFHGNMTMVSYMQKKGRDVVVLSTMHDDKAVEVIMYYNETKGGVDTVDQMINNCQRARRWHMVLWYNMLDLAILIAYTNFTAQHPDYIDGVSSALRLFIKELGKSSSCLI